MKILVVNDDGYKSKGIEILVQALLPFGSVYVSAPCDEQSAKSHGISIGSSIEVKQVPLIKGSLGTIAVCGTPADAARVGIRLFAVDFDLVVSGINNGRNIARDIIYSGTIAAASEARLYKIPAVAISTPNLELNYLIEETTNIMKDIISRKLYNIDGILNVNFPSEKHIKPKGIKYTTQGLRHFDNDFIKKNNDENDNSYHITHVVTKYDETDNSDVRAYDEGYTSITPLSLDRTCYNTLEKLNKK